MKLNEIRLGNYIVQYVPIGYAFDEETDKELEESPINSEDLSWFADTEEDLDKCQPIPLTDEWVLKFGFENHKPGFYRIDIDKNNHRFLEIHLSLNSLWVCTIALVFKNTQEDFEVFLNEIQYVHQLQNLFFSLTGQELEIKTE